MPSRLSLRQNIIWNSSGSFIYLALQWLVTYLVVILLGFKNAGIFSLAMSIATVGFAVSLYGIRGYQVSDISRKYSDKTYVATRFITSVLSLSGVLLFLFFMSYDSYTLACIVVYVLFKISESFVDVYHGITQRGMRMDFIGKSFIIRGVLSSSLFILVAVITKDLLLALFAQAFMSYALIFIYDRRKANLFMQPKNQTSTRKMIQLLIECLPLAVFTLLSNLLMSIPRISLEDAKGSEMLGIYASIAIPAAIIPVVAGFIFSPILTVFAEHVDAKNFKQFNMLFSRTLFYILGFSAIGVAVGSVFGNSMLHLLFGGGITHYTYLFVPILFLSCITALSWFIGLMLTVLREFTGLITATVLATGICALASRYFINNFGLNGVNLILIISLVIQVTIMTSFMFYRLKRIKNRVS